MRVAWSTQCGGGAVCYQPDLSFAGQGRAFPYIPDADIPVLLWQQGRMATGSTALQKTFAGASVRRSAMVAIIVGTTLNAINQGPELMRGVHPVLWKLALTYCVPFVVASYGSYAAFRIAEKQPDSIG